MFWRFSELSTFARVVLGSLQADTLSSAAEKLDAIIAEKENRLDDAKP